MNAMQRYYWQLPSPVGMLTLVSDGESLLELHMDKLRIGADWVKDQRRLRTVCTQLEAYFAGRRRNFDLPLAPRGTAFQQRVWQALRTIPFGQTCSYRDLAGMIGNPAASRAVGGANRRNPIGLIIPCHRVIAADGGLGGYACGLARKRWLLEHEARCTKKGLSRAV